MAERVEVNEKSWHPVVPKIVQAVRVMAILLPSKILVDDVNMDSVLSIAPALVYQVSYEDYV